MSDYDIESRHIKEKACWDRVLLRSSTDLEFRKKLIAEPNNVLLSYGIEVAANIKFIVHEFELNHQHIFLPPLASMIAKPAITRLTQEHQQKGGANG